MYYIFIIVFLTLNQAGCVAPTDTTPTPAPTTCPVTCDNVVFSCVINTSCTKFGTCYVDAIINHSIEPNTAGDSCEKQYSAGASPFKAVRDCNCEPGNTTKECQYKYGYPTPLGDASTP